MMVTPGEVQKLREKSGAGIMDCKKALESSNGDLEKAIQFLREKGKSSAVQKAGRFAGQGLVCVWIRPDTKKGGIVELNCESDFVARTQEFQNLAKELTNRVVENSISSVESLMARPLDGSKETVESHLKEKIGKLGENILIKRIAYLGEGNDTFVGSYVHAPFENSSTCGHLGVLLELKTDRGFAEVSDLLRELCLQVAAASPKWVRKEDVPAVVLEKEMEIYKEQCRQSGKPEKVWEKIIEGKLNDFFKLFCLLEQSHIRDSSGKSSVLSFINQFSKKISGTVTVQNFLRFKMGEE